MIEPFEAAALGIIQGIAEYLPVSSSGHLVIAQSLFGLREPALFFDVTLHMGTLGAVLWFYRADLAGALGEFASGARGIFAGRGFGETLAANAGFRLMFLIAVATVPTGVIGIVFKSEFESLFGSARLAGAMLIVTGVILLLTRFTSGGGRDISGMRWWEAALIGVVQGLAIMPGISRSGSTISAALFLGIGRETAARFSFLMSIPSIVGAMALNLGPGDAGVPAASLAVGFFSALVVGYLCLALLVALVKRGFLSWFSFYCFFAGAVTLAFLS